MLPANIPCDTPDRLELAGPLLSPSRHAEAIEAWRACEAERDALRREVAYTPAEDAATQQAGAQKQERVSCETCANMAFRCKRPEPWVQAFAEAGGYHQGVNCALYDPDPRRRREGVEAMEVRDEH